MERLAITGALFIFAVAAAVGYSITPTNSVTPIPKQHAKQFYDRVMPSLNATVINYKAGDLTIEKKDKVVEPAPCALKRRVRSPIDGRCYFPERLP